MRILGGLIVLLSAASAFGQVIYEPMRYQYKSGGRMYYYGGADPRVHQTAAWPYAYGVDWGRQGGMAFHSAGIHTHREVVTEMPRVYTDAMPYRNAWIFGFTANDAANEARYNVPLYWRKSDMARSAIPTERGWVVPAQWQKFSNDSGTIEIRPYRAAAKSPVKERPVLVIPKDLLDKKLWGPSDKLMTMAD